MTDKNIIVRQLIEDDAYALRSLLEARYSQLKKGKHNRSENIVNDQFDRFMKHYMFFEWNDEGLPHPDYPGRAYGVFHDNKLIAALTQWIGTGAVRSHHFGNLVIDPGVSVTYDVATTGIARAVDIAVEDAELHGYNSFYWLTALKGWNYREEKWFEASRTFKRYNVYIENIIPKGTRPLFSHEWVIMGKQHHNIPVAIKYAKLKPHLIHEIFKSKGLLKQDYVPLQEFNMQEPTNSNISFIPTDNNVTADSVTEPLLKVSETKAPRVIRVTPTTTTEPATTFNCREISYEELMQYESYFLDKFLPVSNDYYANMPNFGNTEWHFYVAEMNGEPVSFTGLGLQPDINRIYHRSSLTMPGKEKIGGWSAVWNFKINEIKRNGWSADDTIHYVLTKHEDKRYEKRGWKTHSTRNVVIDDIEYEQTIWYIKWQDLLEHPAQKPYVE